jgi:hypothetical protein
MYTELDWTEHTAECTCCGRRFRLCRAAIEEAQRAEPTWTLAETVECFDTCISCSFGVDEPEEFNLPAKAPASPAGWLEPGTPEWDAAWAQVVRFYGSVDGFQYMGTWSQPEGPNFHSFRNRDYPLPGASGRTERINFNVTIDGTRAWDTRTPNEPAATPTVRTTALGLAPLVAILILAAGCAGHADAAPAGPTAAQLECLTDEECEAAWGFGLADAMTF